MVQISSGPISKVIQGLHSYLKVTSYAISIGSKINPGFLYQN